MEAFDGGRPLRVVVFFSGGASGFRYLSEHDHNYGASYEVVGGFTTDPDCAGVEALEARDVPVEVNDVRAFYHERGADPTDLDVRAEFDAETADRIARFDPDLLLLSGYMWILTDPLLEAYPILNVHPADLTITDEAGERTYVGKNPVHDAIRDGRPETRSSVHFVTPGVDEGPVLVLSRPFPVHVDLVETLVEFDDGEALLNYAEAHQEWMKWEGDGPAIAKGLELIADGRVELTEGEALVDGEPGPYERPLE